MSSILRAKSVTLSRSILFNRGGGVLAVCETTRNLDRPDGAQYQGVSTVRDNTCMYITSLHDNAEDINKYEVPGTMFLFVFETCPTLIYAETLIKNLRSKKKKYKGQCKKGSGSNVQRRAWAWPSLLGPIRVALWSLGAIYPGRVFAPNLMSLTGGLMLKWLDFRFQRLLKGQESSAPQNMM